jgi:hypothetical protein
MILEGREEVGDACLLEQCYVFRYLRKREAVYPMVIQRD